MAERQSNGREQKNDEEEEYYVCDVRIICIFSRIM